MKELAGIVLCLGIVGACKTSESHKTMSAEASHEETLGTLGAHEDVKEEAQKDLHETVKTGPVEEYHEDLAPDGGVAGKTWRRWGGSTSESWLKESASAEEHLDLDAGVASSKANSKVGTDEGEKKSAPALSCAFGGWLWAGALIAAALLGLRILGRKP